MEGKVRALDGLWSFIGHRSSGSLREISYDDIDELSRTFDGLSLSEKDRIYHQYQCAMSIANRLEIGELAALLHGWVLGDDGLSEFRRWLILQGERIYTIAVCAPDQFSEFLGEDGDIPPAHVVWLDSLDDFGVGFPDRLEGLRGPVWGWSDTSVDQIKSRLPKLWAILGNKLKWDDDSGEIDHRCETDECSIDGIGVIRVGGKLKSKKVVKY